MNLVPEAIFELLIDNLADINKKDRNEETALFLVVKHNKPENFVSSSVLLNFLIDKGANVDAPNKKPYEYRPLYFAAESGNENNLISLIKAGAVVNYKNQFGHSAFTAAKSESIRNIVAAYNDNPLKFLKDNNANNMQIEKSLEANKDHINSQECILSSQEKTEIFNIIDKAEEKKPNNLDPGNFKTENRASSSSISR